MSSLPEDGMTTWCGGCGRPYFRADGHDCPKGRRLPLSDAYVDRQWRRLLAQLESRGRHARPESGQSR